MNTERLSILSAALRANAANPTGAKFSLMDWGKFEEEKGPKLDCGTTACAVGLACLTPSLNKEGLSAHISHFSHWDSITPKFEGYTGWTAVEQFFVLDYRQANWLFYKSNYKVRIGAEAELAVADRIDAFIISGGTTPENVHLA